MFDTGVELELLLPLLSFSLRDREQIKKIIENRTIKMWLNFPH